MLDAGCQLGDDQGSSQSRGGDEGYRGLGEASRMLTAKDAGSQLCEILPGLLPGPATSPATDQLCGFGQLA